MESVSKIWHSFATESFPSPLPNASSHSNAHDVLTSPEARASPPWSPSPVARPRPSLQQGSQTPVNVAPPSRSALPAWAQPLPPPPRQSKESTAVTVYSETYVRHLQSIVDQTRRHSTEIERSVTELARQLEETQRECDELRRVTTQGKVVMQKEHRERVHLENEMSKMSNVIEALERERDRAEQERDIYRERFTVLSRVPQQHTRRSDMVNSFVDRYIQSSPDTPPSTWKISNGGSLRRDELIRYLEMLDREHVAALSKESVFDFARVLMHRVIVRAASQEEGGNLCATASQLVLDKKAGLVLSQEGWDTPPSLPTSTKTKRTDSSYRAQNRERTPSPPAACEKNVVHLYYDRMYRIARDRLAPSEAPKMLEQIRAELEKTRGDEKRCGEVLRRLLKYVGLAKEPIRDFHLDSNPRVFLEFKMKGECVGRLEIELYTHICPKTCKNFQAWCCGTHAYPGGKVMTYEGMKINTIMRGFAFFAGPRTPVSIFPKQKFPTESFEILPDQPGRVMTDNGGNPDNNTATFSVSAAAWFDDWIYMGVCFGQVVRNLELVVQLCELPVMAGGLVPQDDVFISSCGLVTA